MTTTLKINRAPVMTLWAAVVAERLGHTKATSLTLAKAVAGLNAQSKGKRLGIYEEGDKDAKPPRAEKATKIELLGRDVPVTHGKGGPRATIKGEAISPESVARYLESKFGDDLPEVREAMEAVAKSYTKDELASKAYGFYEKFRPKIPEGTKGWGAKGELSLTKINGLAKKK
jgi:hypothetical protein